MRAKNLKWIIMPLVLVLAVGCAVNPVTGKRQVMLFSEKEEIAMGQATDQEISAMYGIYNDARLNDYVRRVGQKLVPLTHRPNLAYHFAVLDTPVVNAFAAPGGYIYVTRGILAMFNSEAELAVIIGHELGHVSARHSMRRFSEMLLVQLGLILGSVLSKDFAKVAGLLGIGTQLLFLKFSRSDEYQADELGISYSRQARYNPQEMISFFRSLQNLSEESGSHRIPTFLSTHPLNQKRIERAYSLLQDADRQLTLDREPYLNQVSGLAYGENPRQGYVEGSRYYHPDMAFSFEIPRDWEMQNTARQVVFAEKNGKAALVLQAEAGSGDLQGYIQAKTKNFTNPKLLRHQSLTISGFSAYQALYQAEEQEGQPLQALFTSVQKENNCFTFTAVSSAADFDKYGSQFDRVVHSFSALRDPNYLNRAVKRMTLVRADGNETLQEIFVRNGMDKAGWKKFSILNGMALDSIPARGQVIKVPR